MSDKRFSKGDIVYWCHQIGTSYSVQYGMVDTQYSDAVVVDLLEVKENRRIDGFPLDEFESPTKWRKLPQGWTWDTRLFEVTEDELPLYDLDIKDPKSIRQAYCSGLLVKAKTKFHGVIDDEISNKGYRIVLRYPQWHKERPTHMSITADELYASYAEAQAEVDAITAEFNRIANLSDYDWAVEMIGHDIDRTPGLTDRERAAYRKWLLSQPDVDHIETRVTNEGLQWKYEQNKRWSCIEPADAIRMLDE